MFSINDQPYDIRHFARFAQTQPEVHTEGPGEILADDDPDDTGIPLISDERGWQTIWERYLQQFPNSQLTKPDEHIMTVSRTQYILSNKNGEPAEHCHQDDMTNPVVADNLETLLSVAADWADLGINDFIDLLLDPDPKSELYGITITREEIVRHDLTNEEKAIIQRVRNGGPNTP